MKIIIFRKHNVYRLRIIFVTDKSKNTEKYEELYILFWQLYINLHQLCKNTALYLHLV